MRTCTRCGAELVPVFPKLCRRSDDDQYDDCLHIHLDGDYGEYIDHMFVQPHYRLCRSCADGLREREPWMVIE